MTFDLAALPTVDPATRWTVDQVTPLDRITIDVDFSDLAPRAAELAAAGRSAETIDAEDMELGRAAAGLAGRVRWRERLRQRTRGP